MKRTELDLLSMRKLTLGKGVDLGEADGWVTRSADNNDMRVKRLHILSP